MTQLRWTKRRSGQRMITVRVEHHLDRLGIVDALAYRHHYDTAAELPDLTVAAALDEIRDTLAQEGYERIGYWADTIHPDNSEEQLTEWADAIADRLGAPPRKGTP